MDWQSIVALLIVFVAALWIGRRVVRLVKSGMRGGSGVSSGCGHCPKNPQTAGKTPVVTLSAPRESSNESDRN